MVNINYSISYPISLIKAKKICILVRQAARWPQSYLDQINAIAAQTLFYRALRSDHRPSVKWLRRSKPLAAALVKFVSEFAVSDSRRSRRKWLIPL
jgi:hypothetical protein